MIQFIVDSWNGGMNAERNPLRHILDLNTRHMVLQVLHGCGVSHLQCILVLCFWYYCNFHVILIVGPLYSQLQHLKLQKKSYFLFKIWLSYKVVQEPFGLMVKKLKIRMVVNTNNGRCKL